MKKWEVGLLAFLVPACTEPLEKATEEACDAGCFIEMVRVGVVSDSADLGILPDNFWFLERDRNGDFVTQSRDGTEVLVFDTNGRILRRWGREGSGPGEYRRIRRPMVGPGDSLHVPDAGNMRVLVYAPDGVLVRESRLSFMPELVLSDGSYLVTRQYFAPPNGMPVTRLGSDGMLLNGFGSDTLQNSRASQLLTVVRLAPAASGGVWLAPIGRYELERWQPQSGVRLHRIVPGSDWFEIRDQSLGDSRVEPGSVIEAIWEDSRDRLWIVARVSDAQWSAPALANTERVIDDVEYSATYDWVIEVLDAESGRSLASTRLDEVVWSRGPAPLLLRPIHSDSVVGFEVLEPALRGGDAKKRGN